MSRRWPLASPLIILLAGCDTPLEDPSAIIVATRLDRGAVMTGELVEITITTSNILDREVTFELPNLCGPMFELRSPDGRVIRPGYLCPDVVRREVFAPRETRRQQLRWKVWHCDSYADIWCLPATARPWGVVAGYLHAGGPRSAPAPIQVLHPLSLSLRTVPDRVVVGERVEVRVQIINRMQLYPYPLETASDCIFDVRVERDGSLVRKLADCLPGGGTIALEPGASLGERFTWMPTEPGRYEVRVELGRPTLEPAVSGRARVEVS
jgi:hypothetical protein